MSSSSCAPRGLGLVHVSVRLLCEASKFEDRTGEGRGTCMAYIAAGFYVQSRVSLEVGDGSCDSEVVPSRSAYDPHSVTVTWLGWLVL